MTAVFFDGTSAPVLGYRRLDERRDLAIIKVAADRNKLQPIELAPNLPRKGAKVAAIGAPGGLSGSTTDGIISGLRDSSELREWGVSLHATVIQTSAPISPGNSGGPLIDMQGRVVGINTAQLKSDIAQNVNFAVSTVDLQFVLDACEEEITAFR